MKNSIFIGILVLVVIGIVGFMVSQNSSSDIEENKLTNRGGVVATMYKSPSCSCCGQYSEYLKREGYDVKVEATQDVSVIKEQYGVPYELESCHTMEVGGYVVEGHVPEEAVQKLLTEKPDIKGIGMAGMPSGSPGMPGPKKQDFVVYEITHEGTKGDIFMTI